MIATLIRALVLTLIWAALQGSFSVGNLLFGFVLGLTIVLFARPLYDPVDGTETARSSARLRPVRRFWRFVVLILVFFRELIVSSVQVAGYIIRPRLQIRSGIVEYPLDVQTDLEITALANLITLTPGTMTLDVDPGQKYLYVHSMTVESDDGREVVEEIKSSLEKHVHRALGPREERE
jgi:multicomponent Na+:H+ antiporter subunit E